MGHNGMHNRGIKRPYRFPMGPADPYWCEWGMVVGGRIRRRRRERDMTLQDLKEEVHRPEGGRHSVGYLSRLERGSASAPLYTYVAIAEAVEVDAGLLLGPDPSLLDASGAEQTLLHYLRGVGVEPHEAILRLSAPPP
jgi:transcriptional regulator with XRE-family HTH domain